MNTGINSSAPVQRVGRRPLWLSILAGFSFLLGVVTTIPQFYYVLFGLHLVTIGPNSNLLGQVWYSYILNGDNSYLKVDLALWRALSRMPSCLARSISPLASASG
ncbi:MAG TPA: hypothetical protein VFQ36_11995 [Ktedonobacteraceae bacterium]|nr:hypothetical protein [Ktedonobacteraceae bacterium]